MNTPKVKYTIKGLDDDVIPLAKASAALQGKTLGDWYSEAAREKLAREKVSTLRAETGRSEGHVGQEQ